MRINSYGEKPLSTLEMGMTIVSMLVGVGILTLPRLVATYTSSFDGWMSILLAGSIALLAGWLVSKVAVRAGDKPFLEYSVSLVGRPFTYLIAALQFSYFLGFCSFETRAIANISKQYLFDRTPVEYISLVFILVVVYGVSGSRSGLLRLNILFLPSVLIMITIVVFFGYRWYEFQNLKPFFITPPIGIAQGMKEVIYSLLGFEIILYYIVFMERPEKAPKAVMSGIALTVFIYLVLYHLVIGIFSNIGAMNIVYPTIELAKEIQFPGNFFERFESLFFVIWIMTIYNTAAMGFDLANVCLSFLFKRLTKRYRLLIIAPIAYLICMTPGDMADFTILGSIISYLAIISGILLPISLLMFGGKRKKEEKANDKSGA
ncbi:germination protein GerLB [Paenibacillus glycanilyticus]|uniref:Germination protein GerLB n=1 Tax=Paenibacillus glycanilyticus TaxID=126569 RepID=A0ABQ6NME8_9BACL|nr:endospore germination permease [Paenibacillus glycanilyticus]GMK45954.1 germination protein GerLB [Paenibacillus glycanilyticus]